MAARRPLQEDRTLMAGRMMKAYDAMRGMLQCDSQKIAAMGYCFGGMAVLDCEFLKFCDAVRLWIVDGDESSKYAAYCPTPGVGHCDDKACFSAMAEKLHLLGTA